MNCEKCLHFKGKVQLGVSSITFVACGLVQGNECYAMLYCEPICCGGFKPIENKPFRRINKGELFEDYLNYTVDRLNELVDKVNELEGKIK